MKLAVLTAAVFPSEAEARQKLWIFLKSAEKAQIPTADLHLYGMGHGFPGYKFLKLEMQLDYLKTLVNTYSHVLYSDGWDAFFTGSFAEIVHKYEAFGSPRILQSAYSGLANVPEPDKDYPNCFDETIVYRYPHVGGYIAEVPAIIDAFEKMLQLPRQTGDDVFNLYDAWQEGWHRPQLDSQCSIFQVTHEHCHVEGDRVVNGITGSQPCIYHLCGGFTDPVTGKDDRLIPWAKALGIIE